MIADRVCFVHIAHEASSFGIHVQSHSAVGSPHARNVEWLEKHEHAICLLLLVLALPASAGIELKKCAHRDRIRQSVRRPRREKVFLVLADDAQFLGRRNTMRGKQEVIAGWSEFFKPAVAPFRWQPERVVTNAAGDLGFSSGPVFDEAGVQIGTFTSTWVRQPDGSWKILFDGGSACPATKQSTQ